MGLDQLHEQNNRVLKGICEATNLFNSADDVALNYWALLAQMMAEFDCQYQMGVRTE